jgi:hypothetical protein
MQSTVEQLMLTAEILHSRATAAPSAETAARLHALGDAVSTQADNIKQRADRLAPDTPGVRLSRQEGRAPQAQNGGTNDDDGP